MVFAVCLRMLRQHEDAEDTTQETLVRAVRALKNWDSSRPLKPWIMAIATNRCRTLLQKRSRKQEVAHHDLSESMAISVNDDRRREIAEEVNRALETLKQEYQTCFVLFYQSELSCQEISDIMNCPVGTVKTWLFRARRQLAEILQTRSIIEAD